MGITDKSIARIEKYVDFTKPTINMCELGAQNVYIEGEWYGKIAKDYFSQYKNINHQSFDIYVHQGCEFMDLREELNKELLNKFDVITDFGTTEHINGNYYNANKNIHNLCKVGGLIIRENPKSGHWIGHGFNYLKTDFYEQLAKLCNYEILDLCEEFAMGNTTDGGNVCVVLRKLDDKPFIHEDLFATLPVYNS
jgi:hypothetical protein